MFVDAACSSEEVHSNEALRQGSLGRAETDLVVLVHRQMRALAGPGPELEDLAQVALEQVLRARFDGRSAFSTFTHAVCYRVWMKHLRARYRWYAIFTSTPPSEAEELIDLTTPYDIAVAGERVHHFYRVLGRVSTKRRAVVILHDLSGEDIPSISAIVAASEATVRTRLRDGRKRLRELLAEDPYFKNEMHEEAP